MHQKADLARSQAFRARLAAKGGGASVRAQPSRGQFMRISDEPDATVDKPIDAKLKEFYPPERKQWAGPVTVGIVIGLFAFPLGALALK